MDTPYFPIWRAFFQLPAEADAAATLEIVERSLDAIDPSLHARAPLLGPLLNVTLSDNDLPAEFRHLLHLLRLNPERTFFADLAAQIGRITEANVLWAAAGTLVYSLFSLVEGVGLMFRVSWACWLAIGESAFFIPIEVYELVRNPSWMVSAILFLNIVIVWYLLSNRQRLFQHHQPQGGAASK